MKVSHWFKSIFNGFTANKVQDVFRIGSKTDFGIAQIRSDWVSCQNYPRAMIGNSVITLMNFHSDWIRGQNDFGWKFNLDGSKGGLIRIDPRLKIQFRWFQGQINSD